MQLVPKSPISNTKENILAFINFTMIELFKEKSKLVIEACQKIKEIEINLKKNICDINKNVSKCLECYKKINETCIISKYENLSDDCLLNNENEGVYIVLRSMLNEPYEQLSKASKNALQSKFKNNYINYENYLNQEISYANKSIESAEQFLTTTNGNRLSKLSTDNIYQMEKNVNKSYFNAQKEYQNIENLFLSNEIAKFIYCYNKDFENQFKSIKKKFYNLSKIYHSIKKNIDNYDINSKENTKYFYTFENWKHNNFTFFDCILQKDWGVGFRYGIDINKFKCFIPMKDYQIFCCSARGAHNKNYAYNDADRLLYKTINSLFYFVSCQTRILN